MTDKNGVTVTAGARCRYFFDLQKEWIEGTVRHTRLMSYYNKFEQRYDIWEAMVDGTHSATWVTSAEIEVVT